MRQQRRSLSWLRVAEVLELDGEQQLEQQVLELEQRVEQQVLRQQGEVRQQGLLEQSRHRNL